MSWDPKPLLELRRKYAKATLSEAQAGSDPWALFQTWLREALESGLSDPNAMVLATSSADGKPSSRIVLLKEFRGGNFTFFTNYESRKGRDLEENPHASLLFFWPLMERQVHVTGTVERISRDDSQGYFRIRPFDSQIGALASKQSAVIPDRSYLDDTYARLQSEYQGLEVPCPENWGGYRLSGECIEFWQGRPSRLHDRIEFTKKNGGWTRARLSP